MAAAGTKPPSNAGCVLALVALPFVVLIGIVLGTLVRNDDDEPEEVHDTLESGELDGVSWRVDAVQDVDGQVCIFLYEDDAEDPLNGTCDPQPQDVTYGDQTVVFGRAEADQVEVSVELDNGETVTIETVTAGEGIGGPFYVKVIEGDVNAESLV